MRALSHSGSLRKRIALFVLWSAVLGFAVQPVSAQSKADPGNNNAPPPGAILDLSGTAIPGSGNGTTYGFYSVQFQATVPNTAITIGFRDDPAFLSLANVAVVDNANPDVNLLVNGNFAQGIYTNNGNANTPIGWTYVDQYGVAFAGGISGSCASPYTVCWYDGAVQAYDAISQTVATTVGHTYTVSFYLAENSGSATFSSVSTNGDVTNTGGNGIDVVVYAQAGVPAAAITQTFNTDGTTISTFNSNPGNLVQQTIDTSNAGPLTCNGPDGTTVTCTGVQLSTSNMTLSNPPPVILLAAANPAAVMQGPPAFPPYVDGTPWSSALCAGRPGDGGSGDLCSLYVNACYGGNSGVALAAASDFYCPFINTSTNTTGYFVLQDTWDPLTPKPTIAPGTTVSLLDFVPTSPSETWNGSAVPPNPACPQVAPVPAMNVLAKCDVSDSLVDVYGDQTTTRGTKPKKGWLISLFNVQMLLSTIQVLSGPGCAAPHSPLNDANPADLTFESPTYAQSIWNNGNCLLGFTVNPAQTPNPNTNNFVAAPPASLFYGPGAPPVAPGGAPEGDTSLTNPNAVCTGAGLNCGAQAWQTGAQKTLSSIFGNTDGTFILHWSAKDAVGTSEKSVALITSGQCTTGPIGNVPAPCYSTTYFTTIVNLDSTKPNVLLTFSPAGGTYSVGQAATASFSCTDPLANGVASGIASCQASVDGGPATSVSPVPLNTATAGAHTVTVTAVDNAGNTTTQVFNYSVLPDADVAIFEQHTSDRVKPGGTLTYLAWALDLSKTSAAEVTVTEQLQLPAAGVNLGNVTASVAVVSCTLSGCTSMPPAGGSACTVTGTTISCNIGTLPSLWGWKGALIKTSIPVLATSKVGTAFKITATVNSPGDLIPANNSTTDYLSICSPE